MIDEDDYRVIMEQIVLNASECEYKTVLQATKEMVETKELDGENRVYMLRMPNNWNDDDLPEFIHKLDALEELLVGYNVKELPQRNGSLNSRI